MTIWLDPYEEEERRRENEICMRKANYSQKQPKSNTDKIQNNFKSSMEEMAKEIKSDIAEIYKNCEYVIHAIDDDTSDPLIAYYIGSLYSDIEKYKKHIRVFHGNV